MDGNHDDTSIWIFIILIIIGIGGVLAYSPTGDRASSTTTIDQRTFDNRDTGLIGDIINGGSDAARDVVEEERESQKESRDFRWISLFPKGKIKEGDKVIALTDVIVRKSPGGSILGEQDKRNTAIVLDGPVNTFGSSWWLLDFKDAPDGWVDGEEISGYVFFFLALNIIPIILDHLRFIAIFITIALMIALIYIFIKENSLRKLKAKKKDTELSIEEQKNLAKMEEKPLINEKWNHVQSLMGSQNNNDWRQAIIEADIMLEEMLTKIGYDGDNIGEQLKNVEESDFVTLNKAWEAHKVRNQIAHKGTDFTLTHSEAERVIGLYESVFREFYYI